MKLKYELWPQSAVRKPVVYLIFNKILKDMLIISVLVKFGVATLSTLENMSISVTQPHWSCGTSKILNFDLKVRCVEPVVFLIFNKISKDRSIISVLLKFGVATLSTLEKMSISVTQPHWSCGTSKILNFDLKVRCVKPVVYLIFNQFSKDMVMRSVLVKFGVATLSTLENMSTLVRTLFWSQISPKIWTSTSKRDTWNQLYFRFLIKFRKIGQL